jgi:DNA-binding NtrC family response regulator
MAKIVVTDDELGICRAFATLLEREGHEPLLASSGEQALGLLDKGNADMVFMDVQLPGMSGLQALEKIRASHPNLPVVVMTAYGTMDTAMEAVRQGAFDYIGKPVEVDQVRALVARALNRATQVAESTEAPATPPPSGTELVGQSPAMQEIFKLVSLLTSNDLHVLVIGETGVGKERVADAIHRHSPRAGQPFVAVNCAAIPEALLESELFGHEKGAFTGADGRRVGRMEAAGAGSLFLDEISELPLHLQSKLLRVLQERSFEPVGSVHSKPLRARVIGASNHNLRELVERGEFREDLYHRLNLVTLDIPPLRQRRSDIPLLAEYFLAKAAAELNKPVTAIDSDAMSMLQAFDYPGNVRQLEHILKRAVLLATGATLTKHEFNFHSDPQTSSQAVYKRLDDELEAAVLKALDRALEEESNSDLFHQLVSSVEQTLVKEAMRRTGDNQVAAARLLGLHRTTLRRKLEEGH